MVDTPKEPLNPDEIKSDDLSHAEVAEICREISARLLRDKTNLSPHATRIDEATRQHEEEKRATQLDGLQQNPYARDARRILFSNAFNRLSRKTQSCTLPTNDHVTTRMTHPLCVSYISKDVARALGANEDLAEGIGLGHDLGHPPLGHVGEVLTTNAIAEIRANALRTVGVFKHNVQSLHVVDRVEGRRGFQKGRGLNLTDQMRHGILSHDGEQDATKSTPNPELLHKPEGIQDDIRRYIGDVIKASGEKEDPEEAFYHANKTAVIHPATLEAAIVRIVDVLHYCPEDFEDMIRMKKRERQALPADVAAILGNDGATMMNRLISDLLVHSYDKDSIQYSSKVGAALNRFKREFLYPGYYEINEMVTSHAKDDNVMDNIPDAQERIDFLFDKFYKILKSGRPEQHGDSSILKYREGRDEHAYRQQMKEIYGDLPDEDFYLLLQVIDFVSGFTDRFFLSESNLKKQ